MTMKSLSLEVRVGLLIMVALVIMGGFLFLLGGVHLEKGYTVYVDFNNPGGLKPGAPVRVAGVRVGTVEHSEYLGGKLDPQDGQASARAHRAQGRRSRQGHHPRGRTLLRHLAGRARRAVHRHRSGLARQAHPALRVR